MEQQSRLNASTERIAKLSSAKLALLAKRLGEKKQPGRPADPIPRRSNPDLAAPLSFDQERLWFLDQMEKTTAAYNTPERLLLTGELRVPVLEQALSEIVRRHEILRTTFPLEEGQPVQAVSAAHRLRLRMVDLSALNEREQQEQLRRLAEEEESRRFDLAREPLFRAALIRSNANQHALFLTAHHIICDAWSVKVLNGELTALCQTYGLGEPTPLDELPIQFADFATWQRARLQGEFFDRRLSYWKSQLGGAPAKLNLPTDKPRPAEQTFRGESHSFELSPSLHQSLQRLSHEAGATLFMTMLAAFKVLLSRYARVDDICVGTPIGGRHQRETEELIGLFVNTLVLRTDLSGNPSFRELLERVRKTALAAYAHQDLPFEKLVEELQPQRSLNSNPLFQAMFVFQNTPTSSLDLPNLSWRSMSLDRSNAVRTDLDLYMWEGKNGLAGCFTYNPDLFEASSIARMASRFQVLVESILRTPEAPIAELQTDEGCDLVAVNGPALVARQQPTAPLSYHQERLWFIDQFESGNVYESSPIYHNIPLLLHFDKPVDGEVLESSLNLIVSRHAALRTRIITENGQGQQVVSTQEKLHLKVVECAGSSPQQLMERALDETRRPFLIQQDLLVRATLFRTDGQESLLLVVVHHIIADKRSLRLMAEELKELYAAQVAKRVQQLPDLPIQYPDYAQWQRALPQRVLESHLFYWQYQLRGALQALELPSDRPRPTVHTYTAARYTFSVGQNLARQLEAYSRAEQSNCFAVMLAAFKVLLHRYANQDEVVVGTSDPCRQQPGTESVIGPFANLLVLRSRLASHSTFRAFLDQVTKLTHQARAHSLMPFDKLVQELKLEKDMSRTALFDVLFQWEDQEPVSLDFGGASARIIDTQIGYGKYDLNLSMNFTASGKLSGTVVYNADIYDRFMIQQMMRHFKVILNSVIADPEQRVAEIRLLSETETHQQLVAWNSTQASYPVHQTIHQLVAEQAVRTPNNIAVVCGEARLTYRELDERANQLAHHLVSQGMTPENLVGVCLNRSLDMIVALLAVLKAGGAYLPLDPNHPEDRLRYILEDSRARYLVTTDSLLTGVLKETITSLTLLDRDREVLSRWPVTAPECQTEPHHLAYCLYTSGSTGKPKGVLLEHRNIVRLLVNDKLQFEFSAADVWTMFHSYCFDFSVWEMYGALFYGGKLVVVPENVVKDPALLVDLLAREQVTVLNQTPSAFDNLAIEALRHPETALALRYVIFGGEALHPIQLKSWKEAYPAVRLINMYGITETTVHVTFKEITSHEIEENISNIGRPIPTTTTYLMDANLRLLPIGMPGEICVGGDGVARAYFGKDDLTRQRFVPNPYNSAERIYRSGDVAKLLPNGEMVYLGRSDNQVQIRGFRVEPGEIRSRLLEHPMVIKAEVIANRSQTRSTELIAYVVSSDQPSITELRNHLGQTLPHYMTPATFVMLKDLPLTANGKVDIRALPAPEQTRPELRDAYLAPVTEAEQRIAAIWQEVLRLERVGVADNFFDLGGHSLLLIQMQRKLSETFARELNIVDLFRFPTVSALARHLGSEESLSPLELHSAEHHAKLEEGKSRLRQLRHSRQLARV